MRHACCNWCLRLIEVETSYNPQIHRRYCSRGCFNRDAIFEEHFSDENIGLRNYEQYGINNDPNGKRYG